MLQYRVLQKENVTHFLKRHLLISGKAVRRLLEKRACKVNGEIERFGSVYLCPKDVVEISSNWKDLLEEPKWKREILLETEEFFCIDKPVGLISEKRRVENFLQREVELVHRLDKETSGCFLLAKTREAKESFIALFSKKGVKKKYLVLVDGRMEQDAGTIDIFLEKKGSFEGQTLWGRGKLGLRAITNFRVLKRGEDFSFIEAETLSGRTHQIRVSFASIGHPILGDRQYARKFSSRFFASRIFLHASEIAFIYRGKQVLVKAALPSDMEAVLP